jgi:hypothetical protein
MLIGFRSDLAIFLFGFAKNERENIDGHLLKTLREIVAIWFAADEKKKDRTSLGGWNFNRDT